ALPELAGPVTSLRATYRLYDTGRTALLAREHACARRGPDGLGIAGGWKHHGRLLELPTRSRAEDPAADAQAVALEALHAELLLHVAGAAAARSMGAALSARLGAGRFRELLRVRGWEDVALAGGRHELGKPAGLQHRRPAADLAGGPLGQADAAGDSLETYVVTV